MRTGSEGGTTAAPKMVTMTEQRLQALLDQAQAKGRSAAQNIGVPGGYYQSKEERDLKIEQAQHMFEFCRAVSRNDWNKLSDMRSSTPEFYEMRAAGDPFQTGDNDSGGYLVPEFWESKIYEFHEQYGFYSKLAMEIPLSGKTSHLPISATGMPTVSSPAEGSGGTVTDANSFFDELQLTAQYMEASWIQTEQFMEDASVQIMDYMAKRVAEKLSFTEDYWGLAGDVSGASDPFNGIINTSGVNVVYMGGAANSTMTSFDKISWKDVVRLMNNVSPTGQQGAVLLCSQQLFMYLCMETDDVGRPIFINTAPMPIGPQGVYGYQTTFGPPLYVLPAGILPASGAGKAAMIYGNLGEYAVLGRRKGLTMKTFVERYKGIDLSDTKKQAHVTYQRVATGVTQAAAFGVLKASTT